MTIKNNILIYDVESSTEDRDKPDSEKDILKFFGCYSYKTNKYYLLTSVEDIQKVIDAHRILVGFNTEEYDELVCKNAGISFEYKIRVDLYKIMKKRAGAMKVKQGMLKDILMSYSLDYITKTLELVTNEESKGDIDYNIFKKNTWSDEELKEIRKYTLRDVEITKKLYEFLEDYFESFKEYVTEEDVRKKKYLTDSPAVFTYKAMCKELGMEPEFSNEEVYEEDDFEGGYVAYPAGERFEGNLVILDFSSLYPNIFIQCNLFSHNCDCCNKEEKWHGSNFFEVKGYYCTKKQGMIEQMYKKLFLKRKQYKKEKNPKEYALKIQLNSGYGLVGNSAFKTMYNYITATDCTSIGRKCTLHARKLFRENGFLNVLADTDSCCVVIPEGKTIEDVNKVAKQLIKELQKHMPFSWDGFEFDLENELKYAYFFKGENKNIKENEILDEDDVKNKKLGLLKKNYILITKDNKVILKNLGIRKKSNSPISKKIFWEYMVPEMKKGTHKFSKTLIKNLINDLLTKDITLISMRKDVGPIKQYKKSPTGIQAQISTRYGAGIHFLIPNIRGVGVGKGKKYCTIQEFKEKNLRVEDVDVDVVFKELEYFTKEPVIGNIFDF